MSTEPLETDTAVSFAVDLAYAAGVLAERERIGEAMAELDATWRAQGTVSYEQRVAARIAEMERHAANNPANTWRGNYPGGPVDFETGAPA